MLVIPLFILLIIYIFLGVKVAKWHKRKYGEPNSFKSVVFRSLVLALCFGVGAIGTEGFGLPAPLLIALFINDYKYWFNIAFIPLVFWFLFFLIDTYLKWKGR